jgi:hypothetical protein
MMKVIQRFGKHCSFHLQGECVFVFWKPYIEQVLGGERDVTDLRSELLFKESIKLLFFNLLAGLDVSLCVQRIAVIR